MNDRSITPFEYGSLHEDTRLFVQQRTDEIKQLMRNTAGDIIHIGQKLMDVKQRLDHGDFEAWLDQEFAWSVRTARRFMNVATKFKPANLADLSVAPSALYLLAAPSTPGEAVDEAMDRAAEGEQITHQVAKDIVNSHKPAAPEPDTQEPEEQPKNWLMRYGDIQRLSDKPLLIPINDSRTLWVAFGPSAIKIAEIVDAEWEWVDLPKRHSLWSVEGIKLYAVNNPAWFDQLMTHVASEEIYLEKDPDLWQIADRKMRTAQYGERQSGAGTPPISEAQGQVAAAANGDEDVDLTDEELEDVTNFLEQMEAEYTDRQFFLDNILDLLDSIDEQLDAARTTVTDAQEKAEFAYLTRQAEFSLRLYRDRVEKVSDRPATLRAIAEQLLDAATERDIQNVKSQIAQAKLGDEKSDAPLQTLFGEAEAKLETIQSSEEAA